MKFLLYAPLAILLGVFPYLSFQAFLPAGKRLWQKAVLFVGLWLGAGMVIFVGDPFNILATLPFFFLGIFLGTEGNFPSKFSLGLIFFTIATSLSAIIDNVFYPYLSDYAHTFLRVLCWLFLYLIIHYIFPRSSHRINLSQRLWLLLDGLAITPFAAMVLGITLTKNDLYPKFSSPTIVILPFALVSGITLLLAVLILSNHERLVQEQQLANARQTYYDQLEQQQLQIRRLRHDMGNHLQILSAMPESDMKPYLENLLDLPALQSSISFCENKLVNIVFGAKMAQAEQEGISMNLKVSVPEVLPFSDVDLCALLGNSLDNAIEACRKIPKTDRNIQIQLRAEKGIFVFQVKNPCAVPPKLRNGSLLSSKPHAESHGLGTVGIRSLVEKYGGTVSFRFKEEAFELLLVLPVCPL